ncbi:MULTISPECIES: EamA family transporter [unclassified Paraburkholderia]|uniref:EamA family transporter n=1 Tax=unclassified Paraburkholderia TaxID=2615204 RepID=UPI0016137C5E|nr:MULTISPECIES: EamA family transporter [unclassified Paraburkholderia]MBB5443069.1 O-acetylserine/cysteine efflux transporter [Paraburkholderia sp. WSM4177]MBB5483326.1 O-acetylserine/cysteine efflux transporter [Paraburkholderia sp. WSM4180]
MEKKHLTLALLVTFVWGINFPITKLGLDSMDPFVLTGVRFALAAIPLVFFIRRPSVHFGYVAAYGLIFGVGMWGAINYGIAAGVAPGIASLIIQLSAFFTMFWGALLFRETLRPAQWIGAFVVLLGLAGIFLAQKGAHQIFGIALIVLSAVSWSVGNVLIKKSGVKEIFSFMVWASLFPPIPLLLGTWLVEGAHPFVVTWQNINGIALFSLVFQVYLATHFSYWGWNSLMKLYPVSTVAPLSLMIPVFGIVTSMLLIGEQVHPVELVSIVVIIAGLAIGMYRRGNAPVSVRTASSSASKA